MDNDIDQKIELVDRNIGDLSRKLAGNNKDLEEKLKTEIREIVLQNDLKSSSEETATLIKTLTGENSEADTETIVKAKEAGLGLNRWTEENIEAVRAYRGEDLKIKLVEETKKNNPNITEEQVKIVRRLADNINRVYNSNGGVENQKDAVLEEYKKVSIGKINNTWNDTQGISGLLKQTPKQFEEIIKNDEEITADLQKHEIKLPYQKFDKVASYDRVMNSIKNPEMRRFLESSRSRFKTLDRISNGKFSQMTNNFVNKIGGDRFRNVTNNFFNKSIVKVTNGFASKIGNQTAGSFVQNSMGILLKNGVSSGMKSILQGAMKKGAQLVGKAAMNVAAKMGLKAAALGLKAVLGAATAGVGYIAMAAWEVLKLGGKLIGNLIKALGLELTNNKFADTAIFVVIVLIVLLFGMGTETADIVSSLVPEVETSPGGGETYGEYTNDMNKVPIPGGVIPCTLSKTSYHEELMVKVNAAGFRTRGGVVAAAKYLSSEFPYKIPYYFGGGHNSDMANDRDGGLMDDPGDGLKRIWGCQYPPDQGGRTLMGLDCSGFVTWCYLTAGFKDWAGNPEYRYYRGSFKYVYFGTTDCGELAGRVKPGDVLKSDTHTGIILWVEGTIAKYAQASPRGVNVEFVSLCNGKPVYGSKNEFSAVVLMENYFIRNK